MHYHLITIFPEIFTSFLSTSLLAKAQEKDILKFSVVNPRDFCKDKQKQVDDEIYGGGAGMLMKAQPVIDAIKDILKGIWVTSTDHGRSLRDAMSNFKIIFLSPSKIFFDQTMAHQLAEEVEHIILICWRYEGIDHRVEEWCDREFGNKFEKVSLGRYVTLGWELPAMCIIEATARLIPWVIKEQASRQDESYRPQQEMKNVEYPQYTRPEEVEGIPVPDVLVSWNHAQIEARRRGNQEKLEN